MGALVLNSARDFHASEYAHAPLIANDMPPYGTERDFCQGAFQVLDSGGVRSRRFPASRTANESKNLRPTARVMALANEDVKALACVLQTDEVGGASLQ